ncbi:SLAM family member 5-like [Podarcis raffonei]|uniref:SLAM family member 5-like n=1 Tax=Podarcis raffonei TaxID=65483 RepID=UPI0023293465|nr:SLAM family member 5-like [Podarcis raffonei]
MESQILSKQSTSLPIGQYQMVPNTGSQLRPDIVIRLEDQKKVIMGDITIPFKNRKTAMKETRECSSGDGNAVNMKGILGRSATFLLNTSEQFRKISWIRTKGKRDLENFVVAIPRKDPEERCELNDQLLAYRGRLSVSKDCKTLQINNLSQEDSGPYTAQIWIADDKDPISETFPLMVYKRLLEADLEIVCDPKDYRGGNGTLQLNCSAGSWEDDATFSWAPASMSESTGRSLVTWHNLEGNDLNFTCKVENPVSTASKTVSVWKNCSTGVSNNTG